jgi:ABC-type transport system involved in cytochrome bd biosynthesis fused ATPase/permease subunit
MILKDRGQPEPAMKLRPSVISEHVVFELESIDRVYLNVYVPWLQREGGVAAFFIVDIFLPRVC